MRASRRLMPALTLLAISLPSFGAGGQGEPPEVAQLLENARFWVEHRRPDLVRQVMRKLLAIDPQQPEALLVLGLASTASGSKPVPVPEANQAGSPSVPNPARNIRHVARRSKHPSPRPSDQHVPLLAALHTFTPTLKIATVMSLPASTPAPEQEAVIEANVAPASNVEATDKAAPNLQPVWQALEQGRYNEGLRLARELNVRHPEQPDVTRALALALLDVGERGMARASLELAVRQALEAPPSLFWVARESRLTLQALDDRQQPTLSAGVTLVQKPGDEAVSRLNSQAASFRMRMPRGDHGHWFVHVDNVQLDAGRSNTALLAQSGEWGSTSLTSLQPWDAMAVRGRASGTAFIAGYEADHWQADVGTSPIGFEFADLSAGLSLKGQLGQSDWRLSVARRPVTSSLLAYGGQRDPATGIVWGGVRRSSALLQFSTTWKGLQPFAEMEAATYRGREVQANREHAAALGADWVLSRGADHYLAVAPVLRMRAFDNNQNHYSVGHGGYYSPQSSTTFSLPIQAAMRHTNLSWLLRVAPSWGHASTASAARFPTRPDLQAMAAEQGRAFYGASSGPGAGWALQTTLEYRMNSHWTTGMRLSMERSTDYARDSLHLYLRWHEKPQRAPVPLWPSTVLPHAGL